MASKEKETKDFVNTMLNDGRRPFRQPQQSNPDKTDTVSSVDIQKRKAIDEYRFTFIADKEKVDKLKAIAAKSGYPIKKIMDEVLTLALDQYEARNGCIESDVDEDSSGLFYDNKK